MSETIIENSILDSDTIILPETKAYPEDRIRWIAVRIDKSCILFNFVILEDIDPPCVGVNAMRVELDALDAEGGLKISVERLPKKPLVEFVTRCDTVRGRDHFRSLDELRIGLVDGRSIILRRDFSHVYQESFKMELEFRGHGVNSEEFRGHNT